MQEWFSQKGWGIKTEKEEKSKRIQIDGKSGGRRVSQKGVGNGDGERGTRAKRSGNGRCRNGCKSGCSQNGMGIQMEKEEKEQKGVVREDGKMGTRVVFPKSEWGTDLEKEKQVGSFRNIIQN